jgi:hypothetical protein
MQGSFAMDIDHLVPVDAFVVAIPWFTKMVWVIFREARGASCRCID